MSDQLSPRQQEVFDFVSQYEQPQSVAMIVRAIGHRSGLSASYVRDVLGALRRKGYVRFSYDRRSYVETVR